MSFQEHLEEVQVGWKAERLLGHAGQPDDRLDGAWHYHWAGREDGVDFKFTIDGGVVSDSAQSFDCYYPAERE